MDKGFYVHIMAIDNNGNVSAVNHVKYVDPLPPSVTVTPNVIDWTNGNVKLTAVATDNETSVVEIKAPGGTWQAGSIIEQEVTTNGDYVFEAKDTAGNIGVGSFSVTNIDKTPPTPPIIKIGN